MHTSRPQDYRFFAWISSLHKEKIEKHQSSIRIWFSWLKDVLRVRIGGIRKGGGEKEKPRPKPKPKPPKK